MVKIILVALVLFVGYAFYQGWLGEWSGGRGDAAACAKARTTVQEVETRMTTGGADLDAGAKQRLAEAREYLQSNCR